MYGREWIVEAYGCDRGALADLSKLRRLFDAMVDELRLRPVGEALWRQFPEPGGITGLLLLAESHLACHTFPEHESLCLNLFCCRPRPEWHFDRYLRREFGASRVSVRVIDRPYANHRGTENSEILCGLCDSVVK
jgi:S-adenosylmethionine decarboxylase